MIFSIISLYVTYTVEKSSLNNINQSGLRFQFTVSFPSPNFYARFDMYVCMYVYMYDPFSTPYVKHHRIGDAGEW
jgi:hypothetical protein